MTLPGPDLPIVLLWHHGPVSFGRDESGRTANRGAGGLVTALIGANVGPPRRRLGMRAATDEDPLSLASTTTSVQHHPGARAAAPRLGRRAWVLSVPVQSDGRPVGTLDVHATSRGLVGRS